MFVSLITSFLYENKVVKQSFGFAKQFWESSPHINIWNISDYHGLKPLLVDNLNESLHWDFVKISHKTDRYRILKSWSSAQGRCTFWSTKSGWPTTIVSPIYRDLKSCSLALGRCTFCSTKSRVTYHDSFPNTYIEISKRVFQLRIDANFEDLGATTIVFPTSSLSHEMLLRVHVNATCLNIHQTPQ